MKKQLAIFTTSALLMSAVQLSAFTANAESSIPFGIPESYSETIDFMNACGNIYVQDDYICFCGKFTEFPGVVNGFSSENSTAEYEIVSEESYHVPNMDDGWYHEVIVFQAKSAGTLDFTWTEDTSIMQNEPVGTYAKEVYHFTFSVDDQLQITETDLFAFVPDSIEEAVSFEAKTGGISVENGYVIYCKSCCMDGGYQIFLDTALCSVGYEMVYENTISQRYDESMMYDIDEGYVPPAGGTVYVVQVLKPTATGYLKVAWRQQREWEEEPIENIEKTFLVYPTVSDITDITETGLTTRVRAVDYYTGENMPDVTLGLFGGSAGGLTTDDECIPPLLTWNSSDEPEYILDYFNSELVPEKYYIEIVSMPDNYNIMVNQTRWSLNGQEQILIELATDEEIEAGFTLGDVNDDGELTTADAVMLQKWLLGTGKLPKWRAADMNDDKTINGFDLALLKAALLEKTVPAEIDVNSLTEEDILSLTDGEVTALYDMLEAGKLQNTTYSYPFPEGFDPNGSDFVAYRYRTDDGNFLYASAETDEEAEAFAQEFFVPENDSYSFQGCEKVYSDENFWIYRSYYSNPKVLNKPYYVIIYNKNYYDMTTGQLHFALNEENLLEFLSIRGISYNLKSFCTETEEQITLSFYSVGYVIAGDWDINDNIEIQKTSIIVDKATGTFKKSTNETVKAVELPGTAKDIDNWGIAEETT